MSVNQITASMQEVFLQQTRLLERSSGFCQRRSRLSASAFVQGLVFGWLSSPDASVSALARAMASAGSPVSPQAVQQRFNENSVTLLRQVLEAMLQRQIQHFFQSSGSSSSRSKQRIAERMVGGQSLDLFPRVWIRDSTVIALPLGMDKFWPACGGANGPSAGLKISVLWDWHSGEIADLRITPATTHDQKVALGLSLSPFQGEMHQGEMHQGEMHQGEMHQGEMHQGEMHLFDLGYFALDPMQKWQKQNHFFCCRYKAATTLFLASAPHKPMQLLDQLKQLPTSPASPSLFEFDVLLGHKQKLPCRLIVGRVPDEIGTERSRTLQASCTRKRRSLSEQRLKLCHWNLYLTNASTEQLSSKQVEVLYRVRWQIERLFRLWKETIRIDCWRTKSPHRILCEIYAKLMGALLNQQLLAECVWSQPARSLLKATQTVASYAMALLDSLKYKSSLGRILTSIQRACSKAARIEKRRKKPSTQQKIEAAWDTNPCSK